MNRKIIGEVIYIRVSDRKSNLIAMKRGNVPTQSWSSKSAVFLMESALTSHGFNKSNKKTACNDTPLFFPLWLVLVTM
jgi:hypothetical protein